MNKISTEIKTIKNQNKKPDQLILDIKNIEKDIRDGILSRNPEADKDYINSVIKVNKNWQELRNKIIIKYISIIQKQANNIASKNPYVTNDDLISYGFDGMSDAIIKYDPNFTVNGRIASFKTYAIRRVFGSIIDNMRKYNDNVSLASRTKSKKINKYNDVSILEKGYKLTDEEMSEKLNMPIKDFYKYKKGIYDDVSFSISSVKNPNGTESSSESFVDLSACKNMMYVDSKRKPKDKKEIYAKLFDASFSNIQKDIIYMKYYKSMSHKEISDVLNINEQKVSVILTKTIKSLQEKLQDIKNPEEIFFEE